MQTKRISPPAAKEAAARRQLPPRPAALPQPAGAPGAARSRAAACFILSPGASRTVPPTVPPGRRSAPTAPAATAAVAAGPAPGLPLWNRTNREPGTTGLRSRGSGELGASPGAPGVGWPAMQGACVEGRSHGGSCRPRRLAAQLQPPGPRRLRRTWSLLPSRERARHRHAQCSPGGGPVPRAAEATGAPELLVSACQPNGVDQDRPGQRLAPVSVCSHTMLVTRPALRRHGAYNVAL